jgi:hypothetical protein
VLLSTGRAREGEAIEETIALGPDEGLLIALSPQAEIPPAVDNRSPSPDDREV